MKEVAILEKKTSKKVFRNKKHVKKNLRVTLKKFPVANLVQSEQYNKSQQ